MGEEDFILKVWREVSGHLELADAIRPVAELLRQAMPVASVELEYVDRPRMALVLAASSRALAHGRYTAYSESLFSNLLVWCQRGEILNLLPGMAWLEALEPLAGSYRGDNVLIGPLWRDGGATSGVAIVAALPGARFDAAHEALFRQLLTPLAVAVANDARMRELANLRAAAEADRQSLLARLGRQGLNDSLIGADGGLRPVLERVDLVARSDTSVLLLGETGSGKEVVARAVHDRSLRSQGPFIRVNCGAIPPELIDSELFGHEKGSFTGAAGQRKGWFERADGGTLFLDEVGELTPAAQVRLLRVLQDGTLYRVGGEVPVKVDVRVVAATHRDLAGMVREGTFRQDLWYRIAVFPIVIPPLRERQIDIPALARHFAARASSKLGLPLQLPTDEDIELLRAYPWPGNVREMASVIERAAILGNGRGLQVRAALGAGIVQPAAPAPASSPVPAGNGAPPETAARFPTLDEAMAAHIRAALARTGGRIEGPYGAARLLAINPHTLRSRMRKLRVDPSEFRRVGAPA